VIQVLLGTLASLQQADGCLEAGFLHSNRTWERSNIARALCDITRERAKRATAILMHVSGRLADQTDDLRQLEAVAVSDDDDQGAPGVVLSPDNAAAEDSVSTVDNDLDDLSETDAESDSGTDDDDPENVGAGNVVGSIVGSGRTGPHAGMVPLQLPDVRAADGAAQQVAIVQQELFTGHAGDGAAVQVADTAAAQPGVLGPPLQQLQERAPQAVSLASSLQAHAGAASAVDQSNNAKQAHPVGCVLPQDSLAFLCYVYQLGCIASRRRRHRFLVQPRQSRYWARTAMTCESCMPSGSQQAWSPPLRLQMPALPDQGSASITMSSMERTPSFCGNWKLRRRPSR
jgi:hypothetical protein